MSLCACRYRGAALQSGHTARGLGMGNEVDVYMVAHKWWSFKRREEARRGLLTSLRDNEEAVRKYKQVSSRVPYHTCCLLVVPSLASHP